MTKPKTIHTSRTMMFAELSKVMDHAIHDDMYLNSLNQNIANKKTKNNQEKTTGFLKQLYGFDLAYLPFKFFKYFWELTEENDKPLLTLLYAIGQDYLLAESYPVVAATKLGDKVTIDKLEENIEAQHPDHFSQNTRRSLAQNIASSWKQAGFIAHAGVIDHLRPRQIDHLFCWRRFSVHVCSGGS